MPFKSKWISAGIAIILFMVCLGLPIKDSNLFIPSVNKEATWIIQWKQSMDPAFYNSSALINDYPDANITVASPKNLKDQEAWLRYWQNSDYVDYIQPNHQYGIAKAPNDPLMSNQSHLKMIHAEEAWEIADSNQDLIIAIVDTGVDLNHPDLMANLVPGVNLVSPGTPPMDDNGHGTGVAGVVAAAGNNETGVTGLLWKANIMPIKALESDGNGDEDKLGEGIRYAVDNGAKIVVLSLGLNKPSPYMQSVVRYAEDRGVLLVAASGNEGNSVKYPAAYPTVLAVGGAANQQQADTRSNFGPELDVMAPWTVYTTKMGGSYGYQEGTSMAAPQVAAVSALIWSQHPELKPYQVRNVIRQSARREDGEGWDPAAGYGMLRADLAVTSEYRENLYDSNSSANDAKPLSVTQQVSAVVSEQEENWFIVDSPYDGMVSIIVEADQSIDSLTAAHYDNPGGQETPITGHLQTGLDIPVSKGKSYIRMTSSSGSVSYRLTTGFTIYKDAFEDNDRQYKAYMLPERSIDVTGTFHQENDHDWYSMKVSGKGTINLTLATDTARIDPVLLIQKQGEREIRVDNKGDGEIETSGPIDVTPGTYYFRVSNIPGYSAPVVGEYTLSIDYEPALSDPNEPNDRPYEATDMVFDRSYNGLIDSPDDIDWFRFKLESPAWIDIELSDLPAGVQTELGLYDRSVAPLMTDPSVPSDGTLNISSEIPAGSYYIKVQADTSFVKQFYSLTVSTKETTAGYLDIVGHWAEQDIAKLTESGILDGMEPHRFGPDFPMTRAQAAAMVTRMFEWEPAAPNGIVFFDVMANHWAYPYINTAHRETVIDGYPDGSFQPEREITRMEMVSLLAKARKLETPKAPTSASLFSDVPATHWGAPLLGRLVGEGAVAGYADGTFKPNKQATRAEFVSFLTKLLK